jgi:cell division septum initiation protein DivIVA
MTTPAPQHIGGRSVLTKGVDVSITSERISGKRFSTVRKDGYDTGEVDQCLVDMERRLNEAERKVDVLQEANGLLHEQLLRAQEDLRRADEERNRMLDERPPVETEDPVRTSSQAAARLLEIATRDAEELLTEARQEGEKLVAVAHDEAARQRAQGDRRRVEAEARVAELTALEHSYRDALASMLASHVEALEGPPLSESLGVEAG